MPNPAAETPPRTAPVAAPHGWRFAPFYVLLVVALWPAPGYAIALMALGALLAIGRLLLVRFRGGTRLLSGPAWALTSALFAAYWLPEAISSFDAVNHARAIRDSVGDVFFLPFLWLVAAAVANERGRRITFAGLAVIAAVWTLDALLQAATGASALFWALDKLKWIINGRSLCPLDQVIAPGRINGMFGDCNPKLGQVLASLSPFVMFAAGRRFGGVGWLVAASAVGVAILLAGARAAWITYALALLFSGWRVLGWKKLLGVFVAGALVLLVLDHVSPPFQQRVERTEALLSGNEDEANLALSGRMQIWRAAACMVREHPINGVGARNFRYAYPQCDPTPGAAPAWGAGPAFHAHQIVLEILSETGFVGLLLWLAGAALAWRAWRYASAAAKERARPAMLALAVTVFPLNTHLAFYSAFWGGLAMLLVALYSGSLLARDDG